MFEKKNNWDIIYGEAKKQGCSTMEDIVEFLKKHYTEPKVILSFDYSDMAEGDEDNF